MLTMSRWTVIYGTLLASSLRKVTSYHLPQHKVLMARTSGGSYRWPEEHVSSRSCWVWACVSAKETDLLSQETLEEIRDAQEAAHLTAIQAAGG